MIAPMVQAVLWGGPCDGQRIMVHRGSRILRVPFYRLSAAIFPGGDEDEVVAVETSANYVLSDLERGTYRYQP